VHTSRHPNNSFQVLIYLTANIQNVLPSGGKGGEAVVSLGYCPAKEWYAIFSYNARTDAKKAHNATD